MAGGLTRGRPLAPGFSSRVVIADSVWVRTDFSFFSGFVLKEFRSEEESRLVCKEPKESDLCPSFK